MPTYQLQIKQVVDYPRCRIYRQFVHRVDGEMMLSIYIFALLIFPMMTVTIRLFPGVSALLPCVF